MRLRVETRDKGGGGINSSNSRLIKMCTLVRWYFQRWIDYYGVEFTTELLEWGRILSGF